MSDFHRFLSSNAEIKLNETFQLYFHVASGKDVSRPTHRRKAIPVRSLVGSPPVDHKCKLRGSLIDMPPGVSKNPDCFKQCCALVALTYKILELKEPAVFEKVQKITLAYANSAAKHEAAEILLDRMEAFCLRHSISKRGPHDLNQLMELFSQDFSVQIVLIAKMTGSVPEYYLIPEDLNLALPRIYLLMKKMPILRIMY